MLLVNGSVNRLLKIVADENIPKLSEYFSSLGEVVKVSGRKLCTEQLLGADVLLVRSVTKVDEALLAGTSIRFVATATIGIDHLDTNYLDQKGIAWANAPGCNANSVVDYVFSCFCRIDGLWGKLIHLDTGVKSKIGIVGYGNVGRCLEQRLTSLGVECLVYDPYMDQTPSFMSSLEGVLGCDVVCLHAPISHQGEFPSYHMISTAEFASLNNGAVIINAGRGAVIDNQALKVFLKQQLSTPNSIITVLDVWEGEPAIDDELLPLIDIATPHIAGYSLDGKVAGTRMIYEACCRFLNIAAVQTNDLEALIEISLPSDISVIGGVKQIILKVYNVADDDECLRFSLNNAANQAEAFDALRKNYPERREFARYVVTGSQYLSKQLCLCLSALGFRLSA